MSILNINDLPDVETSELTDSDMLIVGTSSGAKRVKANSLGGGGSDFSYDLNFSATAEDIVNDKFTGLSITLSIDKSFNDLYDKVESGESLTISGGVVLEQGIVWVYPVSVDASGAAPAELLLEMGFTADGDGIILSIVQFKAGTGVTQMSRMYLVYEENGVIQYVDVS